MYKLHLRSAARRLRARFAVLSIKTRFALGPVKKRHGRYKNDTRRRRQSHRQPAWTLTSPPLPGPTAGQTELRPCSPAAAATIDELLAKEALASLKRSRATAHADTVKSKARILVPPATLVVKPPQTHAWMTPFITLAVMVGISTFLCTGGVAYLFLRPLAVTATSDAELRNIREFGWAVATNGGSAVE